MNENENLNTQTSATSEPPMDYSFDFSNQVGTTTDSAAPEQAPKVEEPALQPASPEVSSSLPEAPVSTQEVSTQPDVAVSNPEVPAQPEQVESPSVSSEIEAPLAEPTPEVIDAVQEAPLADAQAQPEPSSLAQANPEVMPVPVATPEASALGEQASVAAPANEVSTEAVQTTGEKQEDDKNILKSGKSTIIFLIIIVAIVAAFIISLPFLMNIGK